MSDNIWHKRCIDCKQIKRVNDTDPADSDFFKDCSRRDGYRERCKTCYEAQFTGRRSPTGARQKLQVIEGDDFIWIDKVQ